jgi:hypothetical protein
MAKLPRKHQKLFGKDGAAMGQFGSAQTGTPVLSPTNDLDVLQAQPAYIIGWNDAVISGNKRPPLEEFNGLKFINDYQNAYNLQEGIAEYSAETEYHVDSIAKETGTGDLYISIVNDNIGNLLSDITKWEKSGNLKDLQPAQESKAGTIPIATDQEVFDKEDTQALTGLKLFNNLFFQDWSNSNSDTGLAQLVPTGVPATVGYNMLTTLLEAGEVLFSNIPIPYKDIVDAPQATFLDEVNDKFIFPSNLNTFNMQYVDYIVRIVFTVDFSTTNNVTTKFYIRLRRVIDDSIVATLSFSQSDFVAETGVPLSGSIPTFVNGETDPFVNDGVYIDILNDSNSGGTVTLQDLEIRIFRN